ncbi:hypothetical protein KQH62_01300 [bacterium]|nr:hypothetical protein [bacterium]
MQNQTTQFIKNRNENDPAASKTDRVSSATDSRHPTVLGRKNAPPDH